MDMLAIMRARHSVRQYTDRKIEPEKREILCALAERLNREGGMHIQLVFDEPKCFSSLMAHYGRFSGCANYISVAGPKGDALDEKAGYYGEQLVLKAQELGLNTCWVAMTHGKSRAVLLPGEKEAILIALGYGRTAGVPHKDRALSAVCDLGADAPDWYEKGMEAVMLAPTAVNQQKFRFTRDGEEVEAVSLGGPCNKIDLGIVKYHFEAVTGKKVK